MAWAIDQPKRQYWRRSQVVAPGGARVSARPLGAGAIGFLTVLVAAWAGISAFVGPDFGYRPTTASAWHWTTANWLLHLVPGAVGVFAGLLMLGATASAGAGRRSGYTFAALGALAAGAWLVLGPAAWGTFESSHPFAPATGAMANFVNQVGANLGPGILLALFAGMALKAGIASPAVIVEDTVAAGAPVRTAAGTGAGVASAGPVTAAEAGRYPGAARHPGAGTEVAGEQGPVAGEQGPIA